VTQFNYGAGAVLNIMTSIGGSVSGNTIKGLKKRTQDLARSRSRHGYFEGVKEEIGRRLQTKLLTKPATKQVHLALV